jgi:hypothetical protein
VLLSIKFSKSMKTRIKSLDFDFGKFKILIFGKEKFIWGGFKRSMRSIGSMCSEGL